MKIALDLNIIIDLALRQKDFPESTQAYTKLLLNGNQLALPLCGYTTLFYLLNRGLGRKEALYFLEKISEQVTLLPFTEKELAFAKTLNTRNHEDACVAASALLAGYKTILTRNTKDFAKILITALSPSSL